MYIVEKVDDDVVKRTETDILKNQVKVSLKADSSKFCILPQKFVDRDLDRIKSMQIFEDDIWIVTFPKCGTTWGQEMVWLLTSNLDYQTAMTVSLEVRFPFVELSGVCSFVPGDTFEAVNNLPRPRYIKSHLPLFLLPDQLWTVKPKIVYIARNVKDAAVSLYHHHCLFHLYRGARKDVIEAFSKDLFFYSPFNNHVLEFWKIRDKSNILFLFFEDMKKNLEQEVKKAMTFFDKHYLPHEIDKLCQHLSFDSMKINDMVNKNDFIKLRPQLFGVESKNDDSFIRKGQVGGYKKELTAEEQEMLDEYAKCSELETIGFEYKC